MPPARILIVEVDSASAHQLALHLEGFGCQVAGIACSSEEALTKIEELKPDLVLMDIRLKGAIDGIQTGSLIRTYQNIPIIYLVDTSGQNTIRRAGATGPYGYIFKPYDERRIFATLETALIRHELESKLQESRQWLNTMLTSIGDGVIATDEHGRVRFINPIAMQQTGWSHSGAFGRSLREVFPLVSEVSREPIDLLDLFDGTAAAQKKGICGLLLSQNGMSIAVETNITAIQDGKGQVHGMVLVFRDITRQREILQEISRQADRAKALVEVASQINSHLELDTVLRTICEITNRTLKASGTAVLLRHPQKDVFRNMAATSNEPALMGYNGSRFEIPAEVFNLMLSRSTPVYVIHDIQAYEDQPYFEDYRKMNIRTLAAAALFRDSRLVGILVSVFSHQPKTLLEDETDLIKGLADQASSAIENAELFEQVRAGRERQRNLTKNLVNIQETERRRIARELHDHLGQGLTGLQFMLETAKNQVPGPQRSSLEQIQEAVSEIIRDVQEMSLNLRPSILDDMGLVPTLLWHIDRYTRQTGIHVNFRYDEFSRPIPLEIETAAYRIVQEALTNAARHAQVQEVLVGMVVQEETLWVEVLDNGKGFDTRAEPDRPSSGLSGMRERAELVGGYLLVESFLNQGTQIIAALPLTDHPLERRKHERNRSAGR